MRTHRFFQFIIACSLICLTVSSYSAEVQVPKASKLYKEILKNNEVSLCDMYLATYPDGKKVGEVKDIKETQIFINAFRIAAEDYSDTALRNYLNNYPSGKFVTKANDAIEVSAWQKAHHENTVQSYKQYLNEYPKGKAAEMAKNKIQEVN